MTNEEKAKELCDLIGFLDKPILDNVYREDIEDILCYMAKWKDEQHKEQRRIIRNHWQEWAIEQLTAFAMHLNKRGAFRDDLCMDFEHEAQSFIESQNNKEL